MPNGSSGEETFGGGGTGGPGAPREDPELRICNEAPGKSRKTIFLNNYLGGGGLFGGGGLLGGGAALFGGSAGVGLSPESGRGIIGGASSLPKNPPS